MTYDFDTPVERAGTSCIKYDMRAEVFGCKDVIPMWIADMDFPVAPFVMEALRERARHPIFGYDFRAADFFEAVQGWLERRNGWHVERDWIVMTPGVVSGMMLSERTFCAPRRGVVIQPPVYPPFAKTIRENGRKVVNNPLVRNSEGKYEIDFEDLDRKLADAQMFLFCNPHNPTGRVFTREELLRVGELCIKHDVTIVSDEIHSDFVFRPGRHTHIASLSPELEQRTVTLLAPSKTFNIAGLATSVAIIPDEWKREKFSTQIERLHVGMGNTFGNIALTAAYKHGDEWVDQIRPYIRKNMEFARDYLAENIPSVGCSVAEGTFLMWLDFRALGMCQKALMNFLANKAGLGLNDGLEFGREGLGYARMNLGCCRSTLERAMDQLKQAIDGL